MVKRSPYSSGKALKKQRNERLMYLSIGGAVLFVLVIGISLLLRLESITISRVSITGLGVLTEEELRPHVEQELAGAYAFFIPKQSSFFYPKAGIQDTLSETFKRIKNVQVSRDGFTGIAVSVQERKPFAQWCQVDRCYFLDEDGFVFAESPTYTGDVYFRYEGALADEDPIGQTYLSPEEFRTLGLFIVSMERVGFQSISLTLIGDEFSLGLPGGGKIIFVRGMSLDAVVSAAQTALASSAFQEKSLAELEYLDLRFPNKAVYKWR
jgi:cell division septal protein FtsQ